MDWRDLQASWNGDITALRPLGDFVLVKPFQSATGSDLIIDPKTQRTKDGRWRLQNRETGNRFGTVIAVGAGDQMVTLWCLTCWGKSGAKPRLLRIDQSVKRGNCSRCSAELHAIGAGWTASGDVAAQITHAPMHVSPGDTVIFPRVPANEVVINGEEYVLLHEESQIYGVVEEEIAA